MGETSIDARIDSRTTIIPRPVPRCAIDVRVAVPGAPGSDDMEFIDSLQKMHSHMVGWMPKKQLESYIEGGHVLIAEQREEIETRRATEGRGDGIGLKDKEEEPDASTESAASSGLKPQASSLGYCISKDRYMGRDDVGIIFQVNVLPLKQRHLIGAMLVKAAFERAAYGCRLFSCWCAQDLQANWFWEALGFVPLAFRTGSRGKQRIHIFWQRRVRESDSRSDAYSGGVGGVGWWFPSQTHAGAVREDRLVFPIPPGTHWRDVKPVVLPEVQVEPETPALPDRLPGGAPVKGRPEGTIDQSKETRSRRMAIVRSRSKHLQGLPPGKAAVMTAGGIRYIERGDYEPEPPEEKKPKRKRKSKPRAKHDPKHVAQARELRDRFLEEVASGRFLPGSDCQAKYDVSRQLGSTTPGSEHTPAMENTPGSESTRGSESTEIEKMRLLSKAD